MLILSFHLRLGLPSDLFPFGFPHQYPICIHLLYACYMCYPLILLDLIILIILCEKSNFVKHLIMQCYCITEITAG
jgi:hypothetical protein